MTIPTTVRTIELASGPADVVHLNAKHPSERFVLSAVAVRRLLVAIMLLAVLLRVGSALYQGNAIDTLPGVWDQVSYDALAQRVLDGHGFSFGEIHWPATSADAPTAHWSFLYTLYLSGVYALFGPNPLPARLIQAVLAGVLQTWLVWRLGKRMFGPTAGLLAAAFNAVYIYFVYYAGALITETFYITTLLWIADIAMRLDERAQLVRPRRVAWLLWAELGLAIGVSALLRQLVLLLVPFLFLWLWWRIGRKQRSEECPTQRTRLARWLGWRTLGGFVLTAVVAVALILPWTARNYRVFDTFVLLNTNAGYVFFWANHPIYGTEFIGILPDGGPSYGELLPGELLSLNEAELDKALFARGVGFVVADPARYALLSISRTREYFKFWPSADSSTISNLSRVGSFGLFLPLMLYGVVLAVVHVGRNRSKAGEWAATRPHLASILFLVGFMGLYSAMHLLTWALIRYRLPVDAALLLFAGYGAADLLRRVRLGINADAIEADSL